MVTRRHFLASQVSGAFLSVVPGFALGRLLTPSTKVHISLAELSLSTFQNLTDRTFSVQFEEGRMHEAYMVEVTGRHSTPSIEQFSVVLRVEQERPFKQGMYHVAHAEMGSFELFLVPISDESGEVRYEAAFSRLRENPPPPVQ